jgi:Flp pilus assembly protein TadG
MNAKSLRLVNSEKGQGTVEFTLAFPILLLLIISVVEAGWFVFFVNSVSIASREAAR